MDLSRCSDEELLEIGLRDAEAFGVLYDRYEETLLGFFRRATGRADLAADLTAEVFAAALASLGAFRPDLGSAKGWLFGIARHELAQSWRKGRVEARARMRLGMEPMALSDEDLERIDQTRSREWCRFFGPARRVARRAARRREGPGDRRSRLRRARYRVRLL